MKSQQRTRSLIFSAISMVAMVLLLASVPAMGQVLTGNIKATVVDPNGAAVTGASITAKSQATGVENKTVTDSNGNFVITNLTPGKYRLTLEQTGFKKKSVSDLNVGLGENSVANQALEI